MPSAAYAPLPSRSAQDADSELDDAFGSDDEETPLHPTPGPVTITPGTDTYGAGYDFEREYFDRPPPGSPPRPSAFALPNVIGNSNGLLPTAPVVPPAPRLSFFRRVVGSLLPTHYTRLPGSDPSAAAAGVRGGGTDNDGVFANIMAKPQVARTMQTEDGQTFLVPEETQAEAPPSYAAAQADSVPPYWETTVLAPGMDLSADMIIEDLPSGSFFSFLVSMAVSALFQFVGFLLTFLLHTSHAAKYGSRAGLGLTLIQYGFTSRSGGNGSGSGSGSDGEQDEMPAWPNALPSESEAAAPDPTRPGDVGDLMIGGITTRDWASFLLMTVGWFLLLSSFIGFWRIKRWERSIRSTSAPVTAEDLERDAVVRANIESVFGFSFVQDEQTTRRNQNDVIPSQDLLEEQRLARDLRAAGLL